MRRFIWVLVAAFAFVGCLNNHTGEGVGRPSVRLPAPAGITFSEINFGSPSYVEIHNHQSTTLQLKDWQLCDGATNTCVPLSDIEVASGVRVTVPLSPLTPSPHAGQLGLRSPVIDGGALKAFIAWGGPPSHTQSTAEGAADLASEAVAAGLGLEEGFVSVPFPFPDAMSINNDELSTGCGQPTPGAAAVALGGCAQATACPFNNMQVTAPDSIALNNALASALKLDGLRFCTPHGCVPLLSNCVLGAGETLAITIGSEILEPGAECTVALPLMPGITNTWSFAIAAPGAPADDSPSMILLSSVSDLPNWQGRSGCSP